ncbi:class F sortase [Nocardia rhizosphaerae]|uniref:Class F sortase n=1 Tax=Nocardia rhizosphaerae TaxID=1691571 RepID=A0ABV8L5Q3_9NOCA
MALRVIAVGLLSLALALLLPDGSGEDISATAVAGSAASEVVRQSDDAAPARLVVPGLGIDAAMFAAPTTVEYDPFLGRDVESFGVPGDMESTTWWSDGPRPGAQGLAVVLGHTQVNGHGVFDHLGELVPGDQLEVQPATAGRATRFRVDEVIADIPKSDPAALNAILAAHHDMRGLALITCGGRFDVTVGASAANTVVIAESLGEQ